MSTILEFAHEILVMKQEIDRLTIENARLLHVDARNSELLSMIQEIQASSSAQIMNLMLNDGKFSTEFAEASK